MKYMLLIHQGDAPTPRDPEAWARLPEAEQNAVYADYKAINETPGVSSGLQLAEPEFADLVLRDLHDPAVEVLPVEQLDPDLFVRVLGPGAAHSEARAARGGDRQERRRHHSHT